MYRYKNFFRFLAYVKKMIYLCKINKKWHFLPYFAYGNERQNQKDHGRTADDSAGVR